MSAMIDQNVYYEIESLKTEVSQLKKYMIESLQVNQMAIERVNMIENVHQFVEKANQDHEKIYDDLDKLRMKMDDFETSKFMIENTLKELMRN